MTPSVLFVTHVPPAPAISGDRVRTLALMRQASARGWRVSLFSIAEPAEATGAVPDELGELCAEVVLEPLARSRRRTLTLASDVALRRAFHERYFLSRPGRARLVELAARVRPDVIVGGTLYAMPYLRALAGPTVLDTQNAEALRVRRIAREGGLRGLAARLQAGPVARYERAAARTVARVLVVSDAERVLFEALAPGRVDLVPNGVDCVRIPPRGGAPTGPAILFVGSLDYGPNVDAVEVLAGEIAPLVRTEGARLLVVGSNPRPAVRLVLARCPLPVELRADVASVLPSLDEANVLAVPLRTGGGTRLKILEAFARGVPVVSTRVGHEGLAAVAGTHLLEADSPAAFAAALDRLLVEPALGQRLAASARELAELEYDWARIGDAFVASLERALSRR